MQRGRPKANKMKYRKRLVENDIKIVKYRKLKTELKRLASRLQLQTERLFFKKNAHTVGV